MMGYTTDEMLRDARDEAEKLRARAEQAERERDEARAERDRAAAELGAICVAATVRPEEDWCAVYGAASEAVHDLLAQRNTAIRNQATAERQVNEAHAKGMQFRQERDALKAKLAEAERSSDEADAEVDRICAAIGGAATPDGALDKWRRTCKRLTACEKVVEAAREWSDAVERGFASQVRPDIARARFLTALRALDAAQAKDSALSVGVAATAMGGHEVPAQNRLPVGQPSDPATGTTRREPPGTDRKDGSTGAVATAFLSRQFTLAPAEAGDAEAPEWKCVTYECGCTGWRVKAERCVFHGAPVASVKCGGARGAFSADGCVPATHADLDALEERIVERVARAASVSDRQRYANDVNTHPMSRLADELRRKP